MTRHPATGRARIFRAARAFCCSATLLVAACAPTRADAVKLSVTEREDLYQVRGEFEVQVPGAVAWEVLTDYDHIGHFVSAIRASAVARDSVGRIIVQQTAAAGVFPFKKTVRVRLIVDEFAHNTISFRDTLATDFRDYRGSWQVIADSRHSHVIYTLEARPRSASPHTLMRMLIGHDASELLEQVRVEMLRRVQATPWRPDDDD